MSYDQTLYYKDSKGKQREWSIVTKGDTYTRTYGITGGKMQSQSTKCKGKNIGKSNETTPEEQAILEAQAKWTFQMERDDYHWDINLAGRQIRPMLALDYLKVPHRVNWKKAVSQPKLDGVRLTFGKRYQDEDGHEAMTRKGETYTVPHLIDPTKELLGLVNFRLAEANAGECYALDGEAYIHGLSLQSIMRLVKKYRKGETEAVKYYLFDLVIPSLDFEDRYNILRDALDEYDGPDVFVLVPCHEIPDEKTMKIRHGKYTEEGYEGLMIRHFDAYYGIAQRSPNLFKYKHFMDDECKIINVWEDNNGNAMFSVLQKNGKECKVTPKRTHEVRKEMLNRKKEYIGKWITCKFQAYTDDDVMQFPVGLALRECDDNGEPIE